MTKRPHKLHPPAFPVGADDGRRRKRTRPAIVAPELAAAIDQETRELENSIRAEQRRDRYHSDPLWRLSKLKDNRERRDRARRADEAAAFLAKRYRLGRRVFLARAAGKNFARAAKPLADLSAHR